MSLLNITNWMHEQYWICPKKITASHDNKPDARELIWKGCVQTCALKKCAMDRYSAPARKLNKVVDIRYMLATFQHGTKHNHTCNPKEKNINTSFHLKQFKTNEDIMLPQKEDTSYLILHSDKASQKQSKVL